LTAYGIDRGRRGLHAISAIVCAARGLIAVSLGQEGERMICELQTPLGSHLARCTCWDEGMIAQQRQDTQNIHEQMEVGIQTFMSGNCNDGRWAKVT
jgi:hypothetical protein